jgi:putative transcriptional regulator
LCANPAAPAAPRLEEILTGEPTPEARARTLARCGSRVRELRAARGMSQRDLAIALGVSRQSINSIENEHYVPSLRLAIAIARFFQRTVEEIFSADEEPAQ